MKNNKSKAPLGETKLQEASRITKEAMMLTKNSTHGGARAGAGRPEKETALRKRVLITVEPADLAMIDTAAKREGLSRSAYLVRCALEKELVQ